MKKLFYIISILMATILFTVWSCSKEEVQTNPDQQTALSPRDVQVNRIISHFKQDMASYRENPQLKSGETVPADSALWYLEATINYSHAFPNDYYQQFKVDTSYLTVPVNADGTVDMALLTQKYDEMKAQVADQYHNVAFATKGLSFVSLTQLSNTGSQLSILVETGTGEKTSGTPGGDPGTNGPFVVGDDWWYGENVGYCYAPNTVLDDAANQLYASTVTLVPDPSGNYYFINEFIFTIKGGQSEMYRGTAAPDNYLDYYLYYSVDGDPTIPFYTQQMLCLEQQEMNSYYGFIVNLMFDILPNSYLPNVYNRYGYSIESFNSLIDKKLTSGDNIFYYHEGNFTFGIRVGYNMGEGPTQL